MDLPVELFSQVTGYTQMRVEGRMRERRRHPRSPLSLHILIVRVASAAVRGAADARTRDISPGGIGILHAIALPVGEEVYLRLPRRKGPPTWVCAAVVHSRLVERGLYRIGLAFTRVIGVRTQSPNAPGQPGGYVNN